MPLTVVACEYKKSPVQRPRRSHQTVGLAHYVVDAQEGAQLVNVELVIELRVEFAHWRLRGDHPVVVGNSDVPAGCPRYTAPAEAHIGVPRSRLGVSVRGMRRSDGKERHALQESSAHEGERRVANHRSRIIGVVRLRRHSKKKKKKKKKKKIKKCC